MKLAQRASAEGKLAYALRPYLGTNCDAGLCTSDGMQRGRPLTLPGYGIELAMKSMEYKAIDEYEDSEQPSHASQVCLWLGHAFAFFFFFFLLRSCCWRTGCESFPFPPGG